MSMLPSSAADPSVMEFITGWGLSAAAPALIPYTNLGYGPDWCHVSAKAHAVANGGKRVHGWALWDYPGYGVMGNFHSVWEEPSTGTLVDMTPPKFGTTGVMFVRDPSLRIVASLGFFDMHANRMAIPYPIHIDVMTGQPTSSPTWRMLATNPAFVAYCATHSLPINRYGTDATHG